jgi:putative endonuclease
MAPSRHGRDRPAAKVPAPFARSNSNHAHRRQALGRHETARGNSAETGVVFRRISISFVIPGRPEAEPGTQGSGRNRLNTWVPALREALLRCGRNDSLTGPGGKMARYDLIAVYLMASRRNGTLYLGVTSDLLTRAAQHRRGDIPGFSAKYGCRVLVWYERHFDINVAIARETQIKGWRRAWKIALIEKDNPQWLDLEGDLLLPRHLRDDERWSFDG